MYKITQSYSAAVPVLLKHLQVQYEDPVRASIARCLETKEARPFFDFIVDNYVREPSLIDGHESSTKEALAAAISVTADSKDLPVLVELLRNPAHGLSRVLILQPLRRRSKRADVKELIKEFMGDPDLIKEIMTWKKQLANL